MEIERNDSTLPFETRREHERYAISLPVWANDQGRQSRIEAKNISLGGMACLSERRFRAQTRMKLSLEVGGGRGEREVKPLDLDAVVLRCEPKGGFFDLALKFPHESIESRRRLELFLGSRLGKGPIALSRDDG